MSPTTPNRAGNGADAERSAPYSFLNHSDAYWASVRSLSNALLHSHHNAAALMEVHRKLSDELLEIARRQQNVALEFSEKLLQQMAAATPAARRTETLRPETFDEYFDSAIQGIREFGQAIADAQVHSLEAIREHTLAMGEKAEGEIEHAEAAE